MKAFPGWYAETDEVSIDDAALKELMFTAIMVLIHEAAPATRRTLDHDGEPHQGFVWWDDETHESPPMRGTAELRVAIPHENMKSVEHHARVYSREVYANPVSPTISRFIEVARGVEWSMLKVSVHPEPGTDFFNSYSENYAFIRAIFTGKFVDDTDWEDPELDPQTVASSEKIK